MQVTRTQPGGGGGGAVATTGFTQRPLHGTHPWQIPGGIAILLGIGLLVAGGVTQIWPMLGVGVAVFLFGIIWHISISIIKKDEIAAYRQRRMQGMFGATGPGTVVVGGHQPSTFAGGLFSAPPRHHHAGYAGGPLAPQAGYPPGPQAGYAGGPLAPQTGYPLGPQAGYAAGPLAPQAGYPGGPLAPQAGYPGGPIAPQAGYPPPPTYTAATEVNKDFP